MKRKKRTPVRSKIKRKFPMIPVSIVVGVILVGIIILSSGLFRAQPISINEVGTAAKIPRTVILSLVSPASYLALNQEVDISLQIATGKAKVTATQIELIYDPAKLTVVSVTPNNLLPTILARPTIADGKIKFILGAAPSSGGYDGTGTLATIKIKPLMATTSTISFTSQTQVSAIGSTESVLRSTTSLTVNSQQQ